MKNKRSKVYPPEHLDLHSAWGHPSPPAEKYKCFHCWCCKPKTMGLVLSPLFSYYFLAGTTNPFYLKPANCKSRISAWADSVVPGPSASLHAGKWGWSPPPRPGDPAIKTAESPSPWPSAHHLLHCNPSMRPNTQGQVQFTWADSPSPLSLLDQPVTVLIN